jgi:hypothetical protein
LQALSSLTSLATCETVCCAASAIITRASFIAIMGGVMTYCLGILLPSGLVLACDSRSNAGVDQVAQVRKLALITQPGQRVIAILSGLAQDWG